MDGNAMRAMGMDHAEKRSRIAFGARSWDPVGAARVGELGADGRLGPWTLDLWTLDRWEEGCLAVEVQMGSGSSWRCRLAPTT